MKCFKNMFNDCPALLGLLVYLVISELWDFYNAS